MLGWCDVCDSRLGGCVKDGGLNRQAWWFHLSTKCGQAQTRKGKQNKLTNKQKERGSTQSDVRIVLPHTCMNRLVWRMKGGQTFRWTTCSIPGAVEQSCSLHHRAQDGRTGRGWEVMTDVSGLDHSDGSGHYNTELLVRHGHTGLCGALDDLVGEGSDALTGNGRQREGVLGVGAQSLQHVGRLGFEVLLLLSG